jgi:hypothetical protein
MKSTSPTIAGFSCPSISIWTPIRFSRPGPFGSDPFSVACSRTREPTGTGFVNRTFSTP